MFLFYCSFNRSGFYPLSFSPVLDSFLMQIYKGICNWSLLSSLCLPFFFAFGLIYWLKKSFPFSIECYCFFSLGFLFFILTIWAAVPCFETFCLLFYPGYFHSLSSFFIAPRNAHQLKLCFLCDFFFFCFPVSFARKFWSLFFFLSLILPSPLSCHMVSSEVSCFLRLAIFGLTIFTKRALGTIRQITCKQQDYQNASYVCSFVNVLVCLPLFLLSFFFFLSPANAPRCERLEGHCHAWASDWALFILLY